MIKIIAIIRRKPGLTLEEFSSYYFDQHAPLARRTIPPEVNDVIVRYVQSHAIALGSGAPPFDCVTEIAFADLEGMQRWVEWYNGPDGAVLRDDEERFMDRAARVVLVSDEREPARGR
jgi:uncharacterized protein (TIGR02118 family)